MSKDQSQPAERAGNVRAITGHKLVTWLLQQLRNRQGKARTVRGFLESEM